jgi:EmrB/QacA subfamily drug resistance transporter
MERKWWTLLLVSIATFMLLLDVTIVNVALPDIQRELHASLSSLQWVVDAYSLMLAAFLLTAGSLGDRLGRRRVFTIGFGIFTFASFLCGIASDPTLLNLARGLQGIGGAGMFATSLALIGQEFHGKDRATAFGVWGATVGGAVAVGPLIGGIVTENFGWEWIFFLNVPIGITAMVLTERKIVNVFAKDPEPIDVPGLITFSLALFLLIFGLIRGNPEGWDSTLILSCLIGAAMLLSAFIAIELRSRHPMLDLSLFRKPAFNGVSAVAFGLSAGMFAMFLYLTIYMQGVLDYSPLQAGLRFLPLTVLGFIVAPISGALSHKIPIRVLLGTGLAVVGVGLLLMNGVSPDGIGDQHHLPPGRDRDRRRRPRGRLPVPRRLEALRTAAACAEWAGRTGRLGGVPCRRIRSARPDPPRSGPCRRRRLRQRLQRDHPDRRDPLLRRRRPGLRPGQVQRFRPARRT